MAELHTLGWLTELAVFLFSVLPLGAKWGTPGSWEAQSKVVAVALNQKVVDKFFPARLLAQARGSQAVD